LRHRIPTARALLRGLGGSFRRGLPGIVAAAILAVVAGGASLGWRYLTRSPRFSIAAFDVRGNLRLSAAEVVAATGLRLGDNIVTASTAAGERALAAHPWVASARLRRQLPDRVVIDVVEHVPAGVADLGGLYLVDDGGHVFSRAAIARGEAAGLLVVTGLSRTEYLADARAAEKRIARALAVAARYAAVDTRPPLGEVHLGARDAVTLVTRDGATAVRLGRGDEATLKRRLLRFDAAWGALDRRERALARVIYVDNTSRPDRIAVGFSDAR
jgi:cell division protein FtsQ